MTKVPMLAALWPRVETAYGPPSAATLETIARNARESIAVAAIADIADVAESRDVL
jgi:hypothetical protein